MRKSQYMNSLFITNDDKLIGCGNNGNYTSQSSGSLGLGHTNIVKTITEILDDIKEIECGADFMFVLLTDGTVKACGNNNYGQLGVGGSSNAIQSSFKNVNIQNISKIRCGYSHTFFLLNDGTVKACGYNNYGQLGNGNTSNQTSLININIDNVKDIECGYGHTMFLLNDGTVKACGYNANGQLGIGNTTNQTTPVNVNISNVKKIVCGNSHAFFLLNDGTVKACGYNGYGQLGIGNTTAQKIPVDVPVKEIKEIVCGTSHSILMKNNGEVCVAGDNTYGQLGLTDKVTKAQDFIPLFYAGVQDIRCSWGNASYFIMKDGSIQICGQMFLYGHYYHLAGNYQEPKDIFEPFYTAFRDIKDTRPFRLTNTNVVIGENQNTMSFNFDIETCNNRFNTNRIVQKILKNGNMDELLETRHITYQTNEKTKSIDFYSNTI